MKKTVLGLLFLLTSVACGRIDNMPYKPPLKASEWCEKQACGEWGNWTISQPFSSVLVYVLAFYSIWVGYQFLKTERGQQSRYWWGVSIVLGGVGALAAGTSFQAFGYEIKCAGLEYCQFTSWWEIVYNILTVAGSGALLIGISHSSMKQQGQLGSRIYAVITTILYSITCCYGVYAGDYFLVSFDWMILCTMPAYLVIVGLHLYQYFKSPNPLLKRFLGCWVMFVVVMVGYTVYLEQDYTQQLWAQGIWFSENDVLHVLMLAWCAYVHIMLIPWVEDVELS